MWKDEDYWSARREHAWRLRAAGFTQHAIGLRLGVTRERVRQMAARVERLARLAEEHISELTAKRGDGA
jgi:ParB-like chromosome segregation protein Spo0J